MKRRKFVRVLGTGGVGVAVLVLAYLVDQGTIDIGEEADISGRVRRTPQSFGIEATEESIIDIDIREQEEGRRRGTFSLSDPDGTEVTGERLDLSGRTNEIYTVEQDGTYHLRVDPQGGQVRVAVWIRDPDEL